MYNAGSVSEDSFSATLAHEFGHAMGIADDGSRSPCSQQTIMGEATNYVSNVTSVQASDVDGVIANHGGGTCGTTWAADSGYGTSGQFNDGDDDGTVGDDVDDGSSADDGSSESSAADDSGDDSAGDGSDETAVAAAQDTEDDGGCVFKAGQRISPGCETMPRTVSKPATFAFILLPTTILFCRGRRWYLRRRPSR